MSIGEIINLSQCIRDNTQFIMANTRRIKPAPPLYSALLPNPHILLFWVYLMDLLKHNMRGLINKATL